MLGPLRAPALAARLHHYDVSLPPDVVVDPEARLYGGELLTMQISFARGDHPILGPLDAPPVFSLTRSVGVLPDDAGATNAVSFLHTSPASWATTDTNVLRTGSPAFVAGGGPPPPGPGGGGGAPPPPPPPRAPPPHGPPTPYRHTEIAHKIFLS